MSTNGNMVVHGNGPTLAKTSDPTRAFEPRDIPEAYKMAQLLVASGLLPRGVQRPEAAFAIIATGRELGLTAMQSLRSIHIIEGKPTLSADLVAALCKSRSDVCTYFRLVESTDKVARYETLRRGEPAPTAMAFSIEDANRAGVTSKDNWRKYPAAMLRARCITALARAVYPDLAMGIYDPDEVAAEPVSAGPVVVPMPETPTSTAPEADDRIFAGLCERVDVAETASALNAAARDIAKAHKLGAITDGKLEALKSAVTHKRALIAAPPPKSAPAGDGMLAMNADDDELMASRNEESES